MARAKARGPSPEFFRFSLPSCQRPFPGRSPLSLRLVLTAKRPAQHGQLHRRCVRLALGPTRTAASWPPAEAGSSRSSSTAPALTRRMAPQTRSVGSWTSRPSTYRPDLNAGAPPLGRVAARRRAPRIGARLGADTRRFPLLALLASPRCRACIAMFISAASVTVRTGRSGPPEAMLRADACCASLPPHQCRSLPTVRPLVPSALLTVMTEY